MQCAPNFFFLNHRIFFFGREIYFGKLHSILLISTRDSDYLLVYISTNKCIYRSKFLFRQMSLCKNLFLNKIMNYKTSKYVQ